MNIHLSRPAVAAVVLAALLLALQGPSLLAHVRASATRTNDDVCQHVSPFLRTLSPGPRDAVDRFCLATLPAGYRGLYALAARVGDARVLSRFLAYALLALFLGALAAAAWPFGRWGAAFGVCLVALSADVFLQRMAGGLPRGFAFALLAATAAAAVHGRVRLLALSVPLAAAFYPAMAVPAGLSLLLLLLLPADDRGEAGTWTRRRRAAWLAGAALAAALAVLPTLLALRPWGATVGGAELARVPEAGPGGRLGHQDRWDCRAPLVGMTVQAARASVVGSGKPWWPALRARAVREGRLSRGAAISLGLLVAAGVALRVTRQPASRRLLAVTAASLGGYVLACAVTPRLFAPQRQLAYPVPVLVLLWAAAGGGALAGLRPRRTVSVTRPMHDWRAAAGALAACGLLALAAGSRVRPDGGLTFDLARGEPLAAFLRTLPPDAFIAGWPNWMSPVPFTAQRAVFVSREAHLPFRMGYVEELRHRMRALVDATFATSPEPLLRLRDEWGVTHLLVDERHVNGRPDLYFRPFDGWVRQAVADAEGRAFEVLQQRVCAQVYADGRVFVLELSRVDDSMSRGR